MDPKAVELINLELDGRLDAAGRAELERHLADPAVRAHRDQLQALARTLARAPEAPLPLGFRESVLQRIKASRVAPPRRHWRMGLALAASVLVAVVMLRVVGPAQAPVDQLSGTLAPAAPSVTAARGANGVTLAFQVPVGPADIVIDFAPATAGGGLSIASEQGMRLRMEGRRIVIQGVSAGHTTLTVGGDVGDFKATLVRNGDVTPFTVRSP